MHAAYESLVQHLDNHAVQYQAYEEVGLICTNFQGEVGTYRVVVSVDAEAELFEVLGCAMMRVPAGARSLVAETIVRANYGLRLGKLEMDFSDGELRYQVAHPLLDAELPDFLIARSFGALLTTLDRYLPAVLSVIYGNELPQDAIHSVEQLFAAEEES
jgi:hypothetical protein